MRRRTVSVNEGKRSIIRSVSTVEDVGGGVDGVEKEGENMVSTFIPQYQQRGGGRPGGTQNIVVPKTRAR